MSLKKQGSSSGIFRCRVCNAVSHSDLADDNGDYSNRAYYEEEDRLGHLCHECYSSYAEVMDEWNLEDDEDDDELFEEDDA